MLLSDKDLHEKSTMPIGSLKDYIKNRYNINSDKDNTSSFVTSPI